jgi:hypothetical protein
MKFTIPLECESSGESMVVGHVDRIEALQAGTFGLNLTESKVILSGIQRAVVEWQFAAYADSQRSCSICGVRRSIKDYHSA